MSQSVLRGLVAERIFEHLPVQAAKVPGLAREPLLSCHEHFVDKVAVTASVTCSVMQPTSNGTLGHGPCAR